MRPAYDQAGGPYRFLPAYHPSGRALLPERVEDPILGGLEMAILAKERFTRWMGRLRKGISDAVRRMEEEHARTMRWLAEERPDLLYEFFNPPSSI